MDKKVYVNAGTEIEYRPDMSGDVIMKSAGGGKVAMPAKDLLGFIAYNIIHDNCSIFHAIIHDESIPIERLNMDFEIVKRFSKSEGFNNGKIE